MAQKMHSHPVVMPLVYALIAILFILLPAVGFYGGMKYQQQYDKTQLTAQHAPDTLIVTRPKNKQDNLPFLLQKITDKDKVKELYDQITNLPNPPSGTVNCPMERFAIYTLDFSENGTQIMHATVHPTGCPRIDIVNEKTRWALNSEGHIFLQNLQQTLKLSANDFYGY